MKTGSSSDPEMKPGSLWALSLCRGFLSCSILLHWVFLPTEGSWPSLVAVYKSTRRAFTQAGRCPYCGEDTNQTTQVLLSLLMPSHLSPASPDGQIRSPRWGKGGYLAMSSFLLFLQMIRSFLAPSLCLMPLQTPNWQAILGVYTRHPSFVPVVVSGLNK